MSTFLQVTDSRAWRIAARVGEALLAGAIIYSLVQANWGGAAMLGLFLAASLVFMNLKEPLLALFDFLFVAAALSNAAGFAFHWYKRLGPYDQIVHGFTSFAFTLSLGFLIYRRNFKTFEKHRWLFVLTITSFGLAIGGFWEIVEWSIDQIFGTALAPNETDTAIDLIADLLGALGAGLLANWGLPERTRRNR